MNEYIIKGVASDCSDCSLRHRRETIGVRRKPSVTTKDVEASRKVGRLIRAKRGRCWQNAWRAIVDLPELANALYVEGWAVLPSGLAIEHGWIELDGMVLDPTLTDPEAVSGYFPVLRLTRVDAMRAGREYKELPFAPLCEDDRVAVRYSRARSDAFAFAEHNVAELLAQLGLPASGHAEGEAQA